MNDNARIAKQETAFHQAAGAARTDQEKDKDDINLVTGEHKSTSVSQQRSSNQQPRNIHDGGSGENKEAAELSK
jgi:hypothetical protein